MKLKRGQVYKLYYSHYGSKRNYMLVSPYEDTLIFDDYSTRRTFSTLDTCFSINLGAYINIKKGSVGLGGLIRIERPKLTQDIQEIHNELEKLGYRYNSKLNLIENLPHDKA